MAKIKRENPELAKRIREFRQEKDLTVETFWKAVGVTKSAGSRYETSGRGIPEPVLINIRTVYGLNMAGLIDPTHELKPTPKELALLKELRDNPKIASAVEAMILATR